MFALRCANPEINICGRNWNPLQHGRSHPDNQKRNLFFAERMKEPTKRRDARFRRHRSSGVAASHCPQRTLSSSLIPLTRGRFRNTTAFFFTMKR